MNYVPLKEHGQLKFVEKDCEILPNIFAKLYFGHTKGQLIPFVKTEKGTFVYTADLIPFTTHLHLPFIMGYDINPVTPLVKGNDIRDQITTLFKNLNNFCYQVNNSAGVSVFVIIPSNNFYQITICHG